jgi:hypothetical protein
MRGQGIAAKEEGSMGRRYSFELFYPVQQGRAAFAALSPYLPTVSRERSRLAVNLANSELSFLTPDQPLFLELALLFPADDAVRNFRLDWEDQDSEWDEEGTEYLPLGVIDLAVRVGAKHAVFTYTARTSGMSVVFRDSPSAWRQFDKVLRSSGGIVGLFAGVDHAGTARYPVLPDGRVSVELNFFDFVLEERDTYWHVDADRWTEAVLEGLARASNHDQT